MPARELLVAALLLLSVSPQRESRFPVHLESLEFPPVARQARIIGDVTLAVTPDTDGHVTGTPSVLSGHPILAEAARANLKKWRFQLGPQDEVKVTYHFKIEGNSAYGYVPTTCEFDLPSSVTVVTSPPGQKTNYSSKEKHNSE